MLHLPKHNEVKHLEGTGNFAVSKYYQFPFRFFYRHKLKMIVKAMGDKTYFRALDFGAGKARIFEKELKRHSCFVTSFDLGDVLNSKWRFDLVVCSSVLEFTGLTQTVDMLHSIMTPNAELIVASPMQSTFSYLYFKLIRDKKERHSHNDIVEHVSKKFRIVSYKGWMGLYFCLKAIKK